MDGTARTRKAEQRLLVAAPRIAAARDELTATRQAHHQYRNLFAWWCDDCERTHDNSEGDARATLGNHGRIGVFGYAWCEREGAYHLNTARPSLPNMTVQGKLHELWTRNTSQPVTPVTVVTGAASAFVKRYNAQRTHHAPMLRGAGSAAPIESHHVALTLGARHALARVNEWSTDAGTREREQDWQTLCAKIDARG